MNQTAEPNEQIVSFDFVPLFSSIPVNLALRMVKEEVFGAYKVDDRTDLQSFGFCLKKWLFLVQWKSLSSDFWLRNGFTSEWGNC
jgi:hypothetical protein